MNFQQRTQPFGTIRHIPVSSQQRNDVDDLTQMEQNLAQIYKDNIAMMTQSLEQYKNEMVVFQKKYNMLRDDYMYNLKVIGERDEELKKCDSRLSRMSDTVTKMKANESALINQIQDLNSQLGSATSQVHDFQQAIASADASNRQREQDHQMALSTIQQQLDVSRQQTEMIRSNVELEVRKKVTDETARLRDEIQRRDTRIREVECRSRDLEAAMTQMQARQNAVAAENGQLRAAAEEQKRMVVTLQQQLQEANGRCAAVEQQLQVQTAAVEKSRQLVRDQQADTARKLQEMIASNREEKERQSAAYEQQIAALRQRMDLLNERDKQRIGTIRTRMASAQSELQSLTNTFRIASPYTNPSSPSAMPIHTVQFAQSPVQPSNVNPQQPIDYPRYNAPTRQMNIA